MPTTFSGGFRNTGGRKYQTVSTPEPVPFALDIADKDEGGFPSFGVAWEGDVVNRRTLLRRSSEATMVRESRPGCYGQFLSDFCTDEGGKQSACYKVKQALDALRLPFSQTVELRGDGNEPARTQEDYDYTLLRHEGELSEYDREYDTYGLRALPGVRYGLGGTGARLIWKHGGDLRNDLPKTFFTQSDDDAFLLNGGLSDLVWDYPIDDEGNGIPFWDDSLIAGDDDSPGYARWYIAGYAYKKEVSAFAYGFYGGQAGRSNWFLPSGGIDRTKMRISYPDNSQPYRDYVPAYNTVDYYRIFDPAAFYVRDRCLDGVSFLLDPLLAPGSTGWACVVHQSVAPIYRISNRYEECAEEVLGEFRTQAVIARSDVYSQSHIMNQAAWRSRVTDGQPLFINSGATEPPKQAVPVKETPREQAVYQKGFVKQLVSEADYQLHRFGRFLNWMINEYIAVEKIKQTPAALSKDLEDTDIILWKTKDLQGNDVTLRVTAADIANNLIDNAASKGEQGIGGVGAFSRSRMTAARAEIKAILRNQRMRQNVANQRTPINEEDIKAGRKAFEASTATENQAFQTHEIQESASEIAKRYGGTKSNVEEPVLRQNVSR